MLGSTHEVTNFTNNRLNLHFFPRAGSDFHNSGPLSAPKQAPGEPLKPKNAVHRQPESCGRRASAPRTCPGDHLRAEMRPPGTSKTYHFL